MDPAKMECDGCSAENAGFRCGCHVAFYCGAVCQGRGWSEHKELCVQVSQNIENMGPEDRAGFQAYVDGLDQAYADGLDGQAAEDYVNQKVVRDTFEEGNIFEAMEKKSVTVMSQEERKDLDEQTGSSSKSDISFFALLLKDTKFWSTHVRSQSKFSVFVPTNKAIVEWIGNSGITENDDFFDLTAGAATKKFKNFRGNKGIIKRIQDENNSLGQKMLTILLSHFVRDIVPPGSVTFDFPPRPRVIFGIRRPAVPEFVLRGLSVVVIETDNTRELRPIHQGWSLSPDVAIQTVEAVSLTKKSIKEERQALLERGSTQPFVDSFLGIRVRFGEQPEGDGLQRTKANIYNGENRITRAFRGYMYVVDEVLAIP